VATTLLHEAAHVRNLAAGVLDTDVNGRHSRKFADTAEAHGLKVEQAGWHGWTLTTMTAEGRKSWAAMIKVIEAGLAKAAAAATPVRKITPPAPAKGGKAPKPVTPPKRGDRNLPKATCACGNSIRASWGVLEASQPTCQACGEPFTVES
jgi:hypothetical protein